MDKSDAKTAAGKFLMDEATRQRKREISSTYNPDKLMQLINEGKDAKTICKELGIVHLQVLKAHLLKLVHQKKVYLEIPGLFTKLQKQAYVNKNGEIKLCMKSIDFSKMKLVPSLTEFSVEVVDDNQIILRKITSGSNNSDDSAT